MFIDRNEAGKKLAERLARYKGTDAVVLALPRGGVVIGAEVARALALPLDIVSIRKIGHPFTPEYAIGVVDEHGATILNEWETKEMNQEWLSHEIEKQKEEAQRRSTTYRGARTPIDLAGKIALIVDDGIATGLTMQLAVRVVKKSNAGKIVVAIPVAPPDSIELLKNEGADEVVVLEDPKEYLGAVGIHYVQFPQVEDAMVIKLLSETTL